MSKGIQDLGNELGYIYVTTPSGSIVKVYDNNADGARKVKLDGVMASAVAQNRVGTSIITIDAPTGVGSITNITVAATTIIDVGTPLAYTGVTTAEALAQDIVDAVNRYEKGSGFPQHTAVRVGAVVYLTSDSSSENGQTPVLVNTGNFTYTVDQDIEGASDNSENFDTAIGYNFYLDADYGATQCSGGGVAVVTSIANAVDITPYIVNVGFQAALPRIVMQITSDSIYTDRQGSITYVDLEGQGAADDALVSIVINGVADSDMLVLTSNSNTITVTDATGNISLNDATYDVYQGGFITLQYNASTGLWYEVSKSYMTVSDTSISTAKIVDLAVTTAKINDLAVTTAKINALAVTDAELNTDAVTTTKILNDNVTVAKVETTLKTEVLSRQVSFETSEVGDMKMYMGYPGTVTYFWFVVDKDLAATDNGTIVPKNNAGTTMTDGTITATASSTIATSFTATPTANNTFIAGDVLTFTTAKTTKGGKGTLYIKITKS